MTSLDGLRVFVAEDILIVADLVAEGLEAAGCEVVGPVSRVEQGLALAANEWLDGALLNIDLAGQHSYAIAEVLLGRRVPFVFMTGYDAVTIPLAYRKIPRLAKPFRLHDLIALTARCFTRAACDSTPPRGSNELPTPVGSS